MIVRLGFVAMSLVLEDASPSRTMTYKSYQKLTSDESRLYRLRKLTEENLANTLRIMIHAHTHGIQVYRLTSKLVPLATHLDVIDWDYGQELQEKFEKIGSYAKTHGMRISAHPDHFTLLSNSREDILAASIRDLIYHENIFKSMGIGSEGKLVLHIGGAYKNKERTIETFIDNFLALPPSLQERIILENDDKTYHAEEVLSLCRRLSVPMVFDVHHHLCNPGSGIPLTELLQGIFDTWKEEALPPKVHFSSPRSPQDNRSHAECIDVDAFHDFLSQAARVNRDFDVMLEAKHKDMALFQLVKDLKEHYAVIFSSEAALSIQAPACTVIPLE